MRAKTGLEVIDQPFSMQQAFLKISKEARASAIANQIVRAFSRKKTSALSKKKKKKN